MKILFILLIFSTTVYAIDGEKMNFTYQSYEGDLNMKCKHFPIDEFKIDWDVTCKDNKGYYKLFRAHVRLAKYTRPVIPMSTYEVLYWVTDRTVSNNPVGSSSSLWFNFKNDAEFHGLTISQAVDKETAGLYLDIKP